MNRKTRAEERIEELDTSPAALTDPARGAHRRT